MKITLVAKNNICQDTLEYLFKPKKKINFFPGDFIYLTLPQKLISDPRGNTRQFSLSSSPDGGLLSIVFRKGISNYKKSLQDIPLHTEFEVDSPMGLLHLEENDFGPHVFIAGGVGIAPFRSRFKHNIDKDLGIPMHVIYSNSTPETTAYKDDFDTWCKLHDYLTIDYIFTEDMGRLTSEKLKQLTHTFSPATKYWLTGSPAFVDSIEEMLRKLKIRPNKIITEKFTGY